MSNDIRWAKLSSACSGITFASLWRRGRHDVKQANKAELTDWENEGGSVAPVAWRHAQGRTIPS